MTYHLLMGKMGWGMVLSQDNSDDQLEKASKDNGNVYLTVFDLTPVFEDVKNPQQLLLQCSNYDGGEVDIIEANEGIR